MRSWWFAAASVALTACSAFSQLVKVVGQGDSRTLRARASDAASDSTARSTLLILAVDGIGRDLLYSMLSDGQLPELAALLGKTDAGFTHAYFAPEVLTTVPSTTGVAWASMFTAVAPAEHGFSGNEFFVREKRQFAAPIPVSVHATDKALKVFTEGYAHQFLCVPTIYETMREQDPNIDIWVSMSQFYNGADRLLMTRRGVLGSALEAFLSGHTDKNLPRGVWADLDTENVQVVVEQLGEHPVPDVLTLYLFGTDNWAHISAQAPDVSRRSYLREIIDPALGTLRKRLLEKHALEDRYVVLVSDHGHTEVLKDDAHALSTSNDNDPPAVLKKAGYRVRPFEGEVNAADPYQSVLAYQGAIAYLYLADRSTCADGATACDWTRPPRYEADVLPAADAFFRNNLDGALAAGMKGTLDMVLTRKPVPVAEDDLPFEVYVGDGKTEPLEAYLEAHPHPTYIAFASRLHELAVGPHGERAGDVLLLAHNGDRERPEDRYYFATPYHSWHGSPSREDSRIPLIVAHPKKSTAQLKALVSAQLGAQPRAQDVGRLLLGLRSRSTSSKPKTARPR
ncbi:MAG TPA: alkaline phosphatase family protein [Polyangiales bacterium]